MVKKKKYFKNEVIVSQNKVAMYKTEVTKVVILWD